MKTRFLIIFGIIITVSSLFTIVYFTSVSYDVESCNNDIVYKDFTGEMVLREKCVFPFTGITVTDTFLGCDEGFKQINETCVEIKQENEPEHDVIEESPSHGGPPIPSYDSELMLSFDSNLYYAEFGVGSPLIYKETNKPVLDEVNCVRYAYWLTEHQKEKIDLYEDYPRYAPWGNQIFPLVDYCLENGKLAKFNTENKIQWSFYRIVDEKENEK